MIIRPAATTKRCSGCGLDKPLTGHDGETRNWRYNRCPDCISAARRKREAAKPPEWWEAKRAASRQYYRDNLEELQESGRRYYRENRERILDDKKRYAQENAEHIAAYQRQYRQDNAGDLAEYQREYERENADYLRARRQGYHQRNRAARNARSRRYYREHKEQFREYARRFQEANPGAMQKYLRDFHRRNPGKASEYGRARQARERAAYSEPFPADWFDYLREWQEGRCYLCGVEFGEGAKMEYDHVIPVSRGGPHSPRNVLLACARCNRRKHARIVPEALEWLAALQDLVDVEKFGPDYRRVGMDDVPPVILLALAGAFDGIAHNNT